MHVEQSNKRKTVSPLEDMEVDKMNRTRRNDGGKQNGHVHVAL